MKKIGLLTLVLCSLHSFLLVNQDWGINVLLFTTILLISIVYLLKSHKCIKNKKGLLWLIPIVLLSGTYFVYDNTLKYLNVMVIPILYLLMYIYTIKPVESISEISMELLNSPESISS